MAVPIALKYLLLKKYNRAVIFDASKSILQKVEKECMYVDWLELLKKQCASENHIGFYLRVGRRHWKLASRQARRVSSHRK